MKDDVYDMKNRFIKDWRMFNESFEEMFGDEMENFRRDMIEFGKEIANIYERSTGQMEKDLRSRGPMYKGHIEALVKIHISTISIRIQFDAMSTDYLPDEVRPKILAKLEETKKKNLGYMLEKDIKKGILSWFNDFAEETVKIMTEWTKSQMEDEGDLSSIMRKKEEEETLSKKEVMRRIDNALDRRDFTEVDRLNKLLDTIDESLSEDEEKAVKQEAGKVAELFMKFIKEVARKIIGEKSSH